MSINVVKHDGANAKPCDSMQNGMERHGMTEKSRRVGKEVGRSDKPKLTGMRLMTGEETELA